MSYRNLSERSEYRELLYAYYRMPDGNVMYPFMVSQPDWASEPSVGVQIHRADGSSQHKFMSLIAFKHLLESMNRIMYEGKEFSLSQHVKEKDFDQWQDHRAALQRAFF